MLIQDMLSRPLLYVVVFFYMIQSILFVLPKLGQVQIACILGLIGNIATIPLCMMYGVVAVKGGVDYFPILMSGVSMTSQFLGLILNKRKKK